MSRGARQNLIAAWLPVALSVPVAVSAEVWREVKTQHFTLVSDADEKDARRVARQFEVVRSLIGNVSDLHLDPRLSITILAMRDRAGIRSLVPWRFAGKGHTGVGGFFSRGRGRHFIALRTNIRGPNPYSVVYHEYVHLLAESNFRHLPLWLNEGLAEFYAETEADDKEVRWGHLRDRRRQALEHGTWIPLEALLSATGASSYYTDAKWISTFYAEATVLTHYLLLGPKPARRSFEDLRRSLEQAEAGDESPTSVFGDLGALQRALQSYVKGTTFSSRHTPVAEQASVDLVVRELSAAEALAVRGEFLVEIGQPAEARPILKESLDLNPRPVVTRVALGRAYLQIGRRDQAFAILNEALRTAPEDPFVQFWSAVAMPRYGEGHSFAAKEERLLHAIELAPEFAPAYLHLAEAYREQGVKVEEGISLARRACELEPHSFGARLTLAGILAKVGASDAAADAEQEVIRVARADPFLLSSVAGHLSSTGRPQAAEVFLREARARRPKEVTTLVALGDWLDGERRHEEAEAAYREALAIEPDWPEALNNLGYMNVLRGVRLTEALDLIRRAVERRPLSAAYMDSLGWALFRLGRLSEAEAALRKALERDEHPVSLDHLAEVLSARDAPEQALVVWRRALAGGDADDALRKALEEKINATARQLAGRR